jgi:hypothetical protein
LLFNAFGVVLAVLKSISSAFTLYVEVVPVSAVKQNYIYATFSPLVARRLPVLNA